MKVEEMVKNTIANYKYYGCSNGIDCYMEFKTEKETKKAFEYFDRTCQILDSCSMNENKLWFYCDGYWELDYFTRQIGFENIVDFECSFREDIQ